jgi:enoyl-[acyl-carrier-protein] reductase (NADH)
LLGIEDVGNLATFLVSDAAAALTRNIEYIDAGYHTSSDEPARSERVTGRPVRC